MPQKYFVKIIALFILILPLNVVSGQVQVERSKEKTVVSGNVYYLHTVKLGQTTYSIARAYETTVEVIVKENPTAADGIKEGEVLRIPASAIGKNQKNQIPAGEQNTEKKPSATAPQNVFFHEMAAGETVYSLSKKYNVTVDDIKRSNPGINITEISIGTKIAIPSSLKAGEKQTVSTNNDAQKIGEQGQAEPQKKNLIAGQEQLTGDGKYYYHKIIKGETLQSLSRDYNVTVKEIKKANKGFLFPKEGEYIQIPVAGAVVEKEKTEQEIPAAKEVIQPVEEKNNVQTEQPAAAMTDVTPVQNFRGSVKVAVLLPFFLEENADRSYIDSTRKDSKGQIVYKEVSQNGDWVFEPSEPFVEMYEGILLAADSLRTLGLNIKLDVYDISADTVPVENLISSGKLKDVDIILGPVYSSNLEMVAQYATRNNIPVVSPVPLRNPDILKGNTTLFRMSPSLEVEQSILAKQVASAPDANVVFIYSDSLMYDQKTVVFRNKIKSALAKKSGTDSARMHEVFFSGRMYKGGGYVSAKELEASIAGGKENIIVLATTDAPRVGGALSLLHNLARRHDIRVIGLPAIRDIETIDLKFFYDLRMMVPIDSYADYSKPEVKSLLRSYSGKFNGEPGVESFTWRGFDMAYYFIGGVGLYGRNFLNHHSSFNPKLTSFDLHFRQADYNHGFENQSVFLIQYNKDMTISVNEAGVY
ncbi:MAG TPA: LysM peptidoglycan-binding domain-containing protein, partial [Bacteroidales bacterium]|nr:LysM peptidoglycan-binding domain-containing protein [Bacteroidales bacterium]HPT11972.1 LysM peptidoglycan-binding domain-containing protein [Bacteroidales bacterium]